MLQYSWLLKDTFLSEMILVVSSAQNGNLEVPVCFLKVKQGYTIRKMEEDKWIYYVFISAGMKFSNKKKFLYGIPAHFKDLLCQYFDTAAVKVKACAQNGDS
jgi:hypothetical protein